MAFVVSCYVYQKDIFILNEVNFIARIHITLISTLTLVKVKSAERILSRPYHINIMKYISHEVGILKFFAKLG